MDKGGREDGGVKDIDARRTVHLDAPMTSCCVEQHHSAILFAENQTKHRERFGRNVYVFEKSAVL